MLDYINDFINKTFTVVNMPNIQIIDIIEIIILAVIIYQVTKRIADTRIFIVAKGILILILLYGLLIMTHLNVLASIFQWFIILCVICTILASQPEIKKIMESTGSKNYITEFINWWKRDKEKNQYLEFSDETLEAIVEACDQMSKAKTGALIVFELDTPLKDIVATGIKLDALITKQLLIQIFEKNTPLHDGAVVVKHDRVESATCYLPLSNNLNINKDLGTRHRAGIGITEQVECFVLIVSEETGSISYVQDGKIRHKVSLKELKLMLGRIQHRKDSKKKAFESVKNIRVRNTKSKLRAVVGAIAIWFAVLSIIDPITTRRFSGIDVDVVNGDAITSAEQTYEVLNNRPISIIVKARRSILDSITTADIKATADINDMSKVYNVPITVELLNGKGDYSEITYQSTENLKIMIDTISEKVVKIEIDKQGEIQDGTYIKDIKSSEEVVTIKGANSVISVIDKVVLPIDITGHTESFSKTLNPVVYDRNGEQIPLDKLQLSSTQFKANIEMLNTKTVPLNISIANKDTEFNILTYTVDKNVITVGADDDTLDEIESIDIELDITDDINNITSNKLIKTIDLVEYMQDGIVVANTNTKLNLEIDLETPIETDIRIDTDNIEIKRLISKFNCEIINGDYTLKVKGYERDLEDIDIQDFKLTLDLNYSTEEYGEKELLVEINTNNEEEKTIEVINVPTIKYRLKQKTQ